MKTPLLAVALALLVGFAALAAALVQRSAPAPREVAALRANESIPPGLLARLDEIAEQQRQLGVQVSMLEGVAGRTARSPVVSDAVTRAEFEAFQAEVLKALEGRANDLLPGAGRRDPTAFKAQVAGAVEELRNEEAAAKLEAARQAHFAGLDELMPKLEQKLGLTSSQSRELRGALADKYDRDAQLVARWQLGEDPMVLGQEKADNHATHRAELDAVLTPQQIETLAGITGGGRAKK